MDFKVQEGTENMTGRTKHRWFFYFNEKPNLQEITDSRKVAKDDLMVDTIQDRTKEATKHAPLSFSPGFCLLL